MAGTGTLAVTPGTGVTINTLPPSGQDTAAHSLPVVHATDDPVVQSLAKGQSAKGGTASVPALLNYIADQGDSSPITAASAGLTASRVNATATTNATSLKSAAGNLVNIDVFNVAAYDVFLKLYNKASAPTVGTDTPVWTIPIKAGTGYSRTFSIGKFFSTGLAYAITKLQVDTDATALAVGDVTGSIDWV